MHALIVVNEQKTNRDIKSKLQFKVFFNRFVCLFYRYEKDDFYTDPDAKHILVMRNGHHYIFDVLDQHSKY